MSQPLFVGREREQAAIRDRLRLTIAGQGGTVFLAGPPGIGKSALLDQAGREAGVAGARVCLGRCFEGDWQPPYGPWPEAIGDLAGGLPADQLGAILGSDAPAIAQIAPGIRRLLPELGGLVRLDPSEERLRILDALGRVLVDVAHRQPLVFVLDDLHWADGPAIAVLQHVAGLATRAPILLIGAYRDLAFERNALLEQAVADLSRQPSSALVLLRGLSEEEVARYLSASVGEPLPETIVQQIFALTGGQPFYTRELFRHLIEEGRLVRGAQGFEYSGSPTDVPAGVRLVVERRLDRLGADCGLLLRRASVLTSGFDFAILAAISGLAEDTLLDALDEALASGLIQVRDDRSPDGALVVYDFCHAIVRSTILTTMNPDRRVRVHRAVADALERYAGDPASPLAPEIAAQFYASRGLAGSDQGVRYALGAAEQTSSVREHAATFLRMARDLAILAPPAIRADVARRLAITEAEGLQFDAAAQSIDQARRLMADATDRELAAFLATVARIMKEGGAPESSWQPLVDQGLALTAGDHDLLWARLSLLRDRIDVLEVDGVRAGRWLGYETEAVEIARQRGTEADFARTIEPYDWRTPGESAAILYRSRGWADPAARFRVLNAAARDAAMVHARFAEAIGLGQELLDLATATSSIAGQAEALALLATLHITIGAFDLVESEFQEARDRLRRLGPHHRLHVIVDGAIPAVLAYYREGDQRQIAETCRRFARSASAGRQILHLLMFPALAAIAGVRAGLVDQARDDLRIAITLFEQLPPTTHQLGFGVQAAAAACWELGDPALAGTLRRLAESLEDSGVGAGPYGTNLVTIARMAALQQDQAASRTAFARARHQARSDGQAAFGPILDYDEALALNRWGVNRAEQQRLIESALAGFAQFGMTDWSRWASEFRLSGGEERPAGLSDRELEVLRLIAAGRTTRDIAATLFVSIATVERHITNCYTKIGAHSRAEATAWALRHGLGVG